VPWEACDFFTVGQAHDSPSTGRRWVLDRAAGLGEPLAWRAVAGLEPQDLRVAGGRDLAGLVHRAQELLEPYQVMVTGEAIQAVIAALPIPPGSSPSACRKV
jgi:hypothetical protein